MTVTIELTLPEAKALKQALQSTLQLAEQSPNIAGVLDLSQALRTIVARAAEKITIPR